MRLLAKDPSERPESANDVLSALDGIDLVDPDVGASFGGRTPLQVDNEAHSLDSLAGGVFVGRQKEMGDLKASLEDALSGRGRLVTLVGEPGICKSRTAQELTTYAGLRGCQVLWGRSYEEQGVPSYWPWVQAIRSYVRERDPDQLRSDIGSGAADIAEVVSDVRDRLPGLPPAPQLEPEQARFRLFDSITAFLKTASQRQPLVLVLDDLHWADQPSLALLQFVARELNGARLLIIGTYRDMGLSRQHPLAEALGELTRERLFQRVLLRGLTQEDVGRFIEMTSGRGAPRGLIEAVHAQTEGNPLFVTEVVRLLVQEGELGSDQVRETDSWTIRIPEGVREVIGRRLNRLSQRCNESLTVASIVGREFTLEQLGPIVDDITEDRLFDVLEEALAARVIEEMPQSVGRYQFTHALIQETLSGEMSTTRKVRLHARIAQALEELYGDDAEAHAVELVHHYSEAEAMIGSEKLVHYSLLAGERALAAYAHEDAQLHFQRGLAARDGLPMDIQTAGLLFGFGRSQAATLDSQRVGEAVGNLSRAFDYYVEIGELDRAVAIAEHTVSAPFGYRTGMAQLIDKALVLVPPDSHTAGRLLSQYVRVIGSEEGDDQAAQEALGRALAIAQREGDTELELRTLASACSLNLLHLRLEDCLEKALRAIDLATLVDAPQAEVPARYYAAQCLILKGDLAEARRHATAALAPAERLRDRWLGLALVVNGLLSMLEGDFAAARDFLDRGLATPSDSFVQMIRTALAFYSGELDEGAVYLERLLETVRLMPSRSALEFAVVAILLPEISLITGVTDHLLVAETAAGTALSSQSPGLLFIMFARAGLAMVAVQRGDELAAEEQYAALESQPAAILMLTVWDRLLGTLSYTMGNLDQASAHFEDALAFCRKRGCRPELVRTCCDYADTLRERDSDGDQTKAISLLDEALAISNELGMRPLMERVLSRREILKA